MQVILNYTGSTFNNVCIHEITILKLILLLKEKRADTNT